MTATARDRAGRRIRSGDRVDVWAPRDGSNSSEWRIVRQGTICRIDAHTRDLSVRLTNGQLLEHVHANEVSLVDTEPAEETRCP